MRKRPLYVANGTMQNFKHFFRNPESNQVMAIDIPRGRQVSFGDFDMQGEIKIISHLQRFGAVAASEAHNMQTLFGLVYSPGQPIPVDPIEAALARNREVAQRVSDQESENAGLAAFKVARDVNPASVNTTTLEVTQLDERGNQVQKNGVDFTFEVSKRNQGRREAMKRAAA